MYVTIRKKHYIATLNYRFKCYTYIKNERNELSNHIQTGLCFNSEGQTRDTQEIKYIATVR